MVKSLQARHNPRKLRGEAMAVTENMLIDIQVKTEDTAKSVNDLKKQIDDLNKSMKANNSIVNESGKFAAELAITHSVIARQFAAQNKLISQKFDELNKAQLQINTTIKGVKSNIVASNDAIANSFESTDRAIQQSVLTNDKLASSYEVITKVNDDIERQVKNNESVWKSLFFTLSSGATAVLLLRNNLSSVTTVLNSSLSVVKAFSPLTADILAKSFGQLAARISTPLMGIQMVLESTFRFLKTTLSSILPDTNKFIKALGEALPNSISKTMNGVAILTPALIGLGYQVEKIDNKFAKTTGKIMMLAGALMGGVTTIITAIGIKIGDMMQESGIKLLKTAEQSVSKFKEFSDAFKSFTDNLNKSLASMTGSMTGSLEQWNDVMRKTYAKTQYTKTEIVKAIDQIVKKAPSLGLSFEESVAILQRSIDLAAKNNKGLLETTETIIKAIDGQSEAMASLGISTDNLNDKYDVLLASSSLVANQLNESQIELARFVLVMDETAFSIGAAEEQSNTLENSLKKLDKTWETISLKIGQGSFFLKMYNRIAQTLKNTLDSLKVSVVSSIPTSFIEAVGGAGAVLKDLAGIILYLSGTFIKYSLIIIALAASFKSLNFFLTTFLGMSISLTSTMTYLLGVVAPIIAIFLTLGAAINELYEDSKDFRDLVDSILPVFDQTSAGAKDTATAFEWLGKTIKSTTKIFVDFAKFLVVGFAQAVLVAQLAIIKLREIMANKEDSEVFNMMMLDVASRLKSINKIAQNTGNSLLSVFGLGTAIAAESVDKMNKKIDATQSLTSKLSFKTEQFREEVKSLANEINKNLDLDRLKTSIMGTDFEKTIAEYSAIKKQIDEVYKLKLDKSATAKELAELEIKYAEKTFQIEKMRLDTLEKIVTQRKNLEIEILKASGKNIQAIKIETTEQLKELEKQIEGLNKLGTARLEDIKLLEETKELLKKSQEGKINEERLRSLSKAIDAERLLGDIKRETNRIEQNVVEELKARILVRESEIQKMEQSLKASNDYYGRSKIAIQEAKKAVSMMLESGTGRLQTDIIDEMKKKQQDLQDTINKDLLTQAENIELSYQKELQLLEVTKSRIEAQGLMNDQIRQQFEDMDSLLQKQKDIQLKKAPGQEAEALEKTGADIAGSITGAFSTGAMGMVTGAMGMVSAVVDVVDKILDFVPQLINKIAGIFDKITQLPMVLLSSIKNLARAITQSITDALPNLMKALPEIIDVILTLLFEGIPDAIDNLIAQLPDLIQMISDRLPYLVEKLVAGLISNSPRIAISLTMAMIKLLPMLWREMFKYFLKLPKIIVNGIVEGLKQLVNIFKGISIKGPDTKKMVDNLQLGMKSVTKTLTGESSKLFSVMDLGTASKAQEAIDTMKDQIYEGAKKGVDYLTMWWRKLLAELQKLWDGLVSAWRKVWEWISQVWGELVRAGKAIFEFLKTVWDEVIKALQPIFDGLKAMWEWVLNKLGEIWAGVKALWEWIFEGLQSAWNALTEAWNKITEVLSSVWEKLKGVGSSIWESFKEAVSNGFGFFKDLGSKIWEGLKSGLSEIGNFVQDIFNKLNPMNLFERIFKIDYKGKGTVESALNIDVPFANFAKGGLVPGNPIVKGDSFLNDRILALLSPGEAIIPRSLMEDPATKAVINSVLSGQISPLGLWKGGISIGGKNIISVGDKGISVGDTTISSANDLLDAAGQAFGNFWGKVKEEVYGMVMKMFEANKFHTGGLVPAFAGGGEVPAMLNPGEFVLNRSATQGLGLNLLNSMNRGGGIAQPNITLNIEINTTQPIDDVFFRNTLMPRIKDDIKRRTLNGEFIISSKGVR